MQRRDFLKYSVAGLAAVSLPGFLSQACKKQADRYSVVILGDTHYDDPDPLRYHKGYSDPNPAREAAHREEFTRNGEMWSGRCQSLVRRAACLVDDDTRFVFQMGDLIQGDTADEATHRLFLDDTVNLLKNAIAPSLPFITVAGNHDVRGNDDDVCYAAYKDYMAGRMSKELGKEITDINFIFRSGPDAFVVIDFNRPDVKKIKSLLEEARGARYVFVIVHGPVFPFDEDNFYFWYLLGSRHDSHAAERREIRALLASLNAIVLCGHTHTTEFLDWRGDGGRITQMTMNSVWDDEAKGSYQIKASGAEEYGNASGKALFDEYRPGISSYSLADSAGSYKLIVDDSGVVVEYYAGHSPRLSHKFVLRTK
ncbi:MAG: metallophosphoesterase [Bacteroidales bacterium]|nr:metallophosphoesterase [Bacteroidales bacterium]